MLGNENWITAWAELWAFGSAPHFAWLCHTSHCSMGCLTMRQEVNTLLRLLHVNESRNCCTWHCSCLLDVWLFLGYPLALSLVLSRNVGVALFFSTPVTAGQLRPERSPLWGPFFPLFRVGTVHISPCESTKPERKKAMKTSWWLPKNGFAL